MQLLGWIGTTVVAALLGLVVTLLFQDRVAAALARLLARWSFGHGRGRDVAGSWFTWYTVLPERSTSTSAAASVGEVEEIRLRTVGDRVIGANERRSREYFVRGVLRDQTFLTGTWQDLSDGRYHHGGFQLCWPNNGRGMVGKFVGADSENHVNHGVWFWARRPDDLPGLATWAHDSCGYGFDKDAVLAGLARAGVGRAGPAPAPREGADGAPAPQHPDPGRGRR